jgi:inorganic pyrophosphatase
MIVETPRGSSVKLAYEPGVKAFTVTRALALGITYPFDWGFLPRTIAEDGDPLDALAVHDSATYPGVILPCRACPGTNAVLPALVWLTRLRQQLSGTVIAASR